MLFGYFIVDTTYFFMLSVSSLKDNKFIIGPSLLYWIAAPVVSVYYTYVVGSIMNESVNSEQAKTNEMVPVSGNKDSYAKVNNNQMAWNFIKIK